VRNPDGLSLRIACIPASGGNFRIIQKFWNCFFLPRGICSDKEKSWEKNIKEIELLTGL
jgi:hypothetical protein